MTLMEILCSRIRGTSEQAEDLALLDLRKRLAKKLLSLADEENEGGKAVIRHSQQDLASMVGITRESINKHLGAWAKDGLVAVGRNEIEIIDEQGLRDIFEP
jgi:CRP-like cAMP-binding protein